MPELRGGPPYVMTEMIAAEPALAERLVARLAASAELAAVADAVRACVEAGQPVTFAGCGTSEHAGMVCAAMLSEAVGGPVCSVEAFEALRQPQAGGLLIGISHEGGTAATLDAILRARAAGARTALITCSDRSPGATKADVVVATGEQDQSWCHTVGYLSPILVGAALAARLSATELDGTAVRALLEVADPGGAADGMAGILTACDRLLVAGSGVDRASARELALKIEEAAHFPATGLPLETVLHGHMAAADERTGLVLFVTSGGDALARSLTVLRAAAAIGMPVGLIVGADLGDDVPLELTASRMTVPLAGRLARTLGAALGAAIPLQLLAERLARSRGVNPDAIGRDDPSHAAAAQA